MKIDCKSQRKLGGEEYEFKSINTGFKNIFNF